MSEAEKLREQMRESHRGGKWPVGGASPVETGEVYGGEDSTSGMEEGSLGQWRIKPLSDEWGLGVGIPSCP